MKSSSLLVCGAFALIFAANTLAAAEPEAADKPANPTAYTALHAMQKSLGEKSLERVVEVTGREGVPQPYVWHIVLREPEGLREVQVVGGKVSNQRPASVKAPSGSGSPLRLQELNLDSSGAFDAADAQARKVRLRFDAVSYDLQIVDGKPEWALELSDQSGGSVGKMRLAANNGTTASVEGRLATAPPAVANSPGPRTTAVPANPPSVERRPLPTPLPIAPTNTVVTTVPAQVTTSTTTTTVATDGRPVVITDEEENDPDIGFFTRAGRTIDHTNHTVVRTVGQTNETVKRSFKRTGATIQRFFTGHSDLDQESTLEPPR